MQGNICCFHFNLKMLKPSLQLQAWCSVISRNYKTEPRQKDPNCDGKFCKLNQFNSVRELSITIRFFSLQFSFLFGSVYIFLFAILISINNNNSVQFGIKSCSLVFCEGIFSSETQNWCTEPL